MSRIPPLPRSQLPAHHQPLHDTLSAFATTAFGTGLDALFIYRRDPDGALLGLFPLYIASGTFGLELLDLFTKLAELLGLSPEAREAAILAVGAVFQSPWELYAHGEIAVKATALTEQQVHLLAQGRKPDGLGADAEAAFEIATHLARKLGALPQSLWDQGVKALGKEGMIALLHYGGSTRTRGTE
ncbi:hypothetical protein LTR53_001063 [Teratosphaeriaceae sp. CCFEE 6253]|nr:hypothetical protein LTR53_001063 [Teratosphaeriaceae sp. CCFEE 6253]